MRSIMQARPTEWNDQSAIAPEFRVPNGIYRHDNGMTVEVVGYNHLSDCVIVEVGDGKKPLNVPRPVAWSTLKPVQAPKKDRTGLCAVAIIAAAFVIAIMVGA